MIVFRYLKFLYVMNHFKLYAYSWQKLVKQNEFVSTPIIIYFSVVFKLKIC